MDVSINLNGCIISQSQMVKNLTPFNPFVSSEPHIKDVTKSGFFFFPFHPIQIFADASRTSSMMNCQQYTFPWPAYNNNKRFNLVLNISQKSHHITHILTFDMKYLHIQTYYCRLLHYNLYAFSMQVRLLITVSSWSCELYQWHTGGHSGYLESFYLLK